MTEIDRACEAYAHGHLTVLQLERRLEVALGLRPEVDVSIGVASCCCQRHVLGVQGCADSARIKAEYGICW